jgi:hypothetical protein
MKMAEKHLDKLLAISASGLVNQSWKGWLADEIYQTKLAIAVTKKRCETHAR